MKNLFKRKNEVNRALVAKKKYFSQTLLRLLVVLLVLPMAWVNAWAGTAYLRVQSAEPARGLVYMSTSQNGPSDISAYQKTYPADAPDGSLASANADASSCYVNTGSSYGPYNCYAWAMPTRGFEFDTWGKVTNIPKDSRPVNTDYGYATSTANYDASKETGELINQSDVTSTWKGETDRIQTSAGGSASTYRTPQAKFKAAQDYTVTYKKPVGGIYTVSYQYLETEAYQRSYSNKTYDDYRFVRKKDVYEFDSNTEEDLPILSYKADEITLSVLDNVSNFLGWCENGELIDGSGPDDKTRQYTAYANVTISPLFKEIGWGDASGDLTVTVGTGTEAELGTYGDKVVYVACPTLIGPWSDDDFTITTTALSNSYGSIALGSATLNKSENRLEIPYSYTATHWGGISVDVTVTPAYGEPKVFTIACSSEEVVGYEACIEESGVRTYTGTLADMMTQANSMTNKPTVKLMNNGVTITSPVSFTKSMTFDVNGKVLTANCASAFSIDAEGIDVQIIDGSFTQVGEIHTSYASNNAVSVVTFTQAAKLTMNGGTLSVANTGAGAAYGVDVQQGSIFYMTGGDLTVTANMGNAQGAHVASANDYATFNGGSIAVSAPTNAYGMWSAGQSNITDATVTVETTTGANAYGLYVNGGTSTITTTDFAVNAKTTGAYGAYVNAGRMNFNGGKLAVEAVTSGVYGVHIAAGATAMMQQGTKVTAEATGASGTQVFGINNLGTVSLNNLNVTATSPTNYATAVNSETSAVSTTIEDGTYTANTETGYTYGLHHQFGALSVDGGSFKGIIKTSGDHAYGARAAVDATIANATLLADARGTAHTAYGFVAGVANKNIALTNCDITGQSKTSEAYAIYSRANVSATSCTLIATTLGTDSVVGVYAEAGTNALTNCSATVTAQTIKAYGVRHIAGSLSINGGTYIVDAKQGTASAAQNSKLYGICNNANMTTTVTNAEFVVTASNVAWSQDVYGAKINGTLNSTGATFTAQAKQTVYGIWGNTASTLNLENNTIYSHAINGTKSYGVYAKNKFKINGDVVTAECAANDVYALYFDATNSVGRVIDGKFKAIGDNTNTFGALNSKGAIDNVSLEGGVYSVITNLKKYAAEGLSIYNLDDTHPDYASGYYYIIATENPSPYVCKIVGGAHYTTLEAAMQYAKDNAEKNCTIVMTQDYTLPAGDYELPSNATLLVPHVVGQEAIYGVGEDNSNKTTTVGDFAEFMCLTLAENAKLNVSGKIEVSAQMWCAQTGHISYINGPYSRIYMNTGSLIQLNDGAVLYAWGKVTGTGEIKVKSNAEVREMFQIYNMPSMSNIVYVYLDNDEKFFPVQQYEISNIEIPVTYYFNSRLLCGMSNYYKGAVGVGFNKDDNIRVVGTQNALFLVNDDNEASWVRKSYSNGCMLWEVNTSAKLGSLTINMEGRTMRSIDYILPISTNMKIHILDGNFEITQSAQLLPGSQIEINKTGTLTINAIDTKNEPVNLYVFDKDQSTFTSYPDALLNVHGKIDVKGGLFTTNSIANGTNATNGANIYSNNADAGTITFNANAASATNIQWITGVTKDEDGNSIPVTRQVDMEPAKLKNGEGAENEFTLTAGTLAGQSFAYLDNEWQNTYTNGCFQVKNGTVYAKPSEYVALKKSQEDPNDNTKLIGVEETNHTYLTADDKILILMDGCQWWEVIATSETVFECTKSGYEGFYYYDETAHKWKLKTVNVTFYMKEEGTDANDKVVVTDYNGVPDQSVIAANPTKETTAAATYTFSGWMSSVEPYNTCHWTATLEKATADMSYRPVFTPNPRHYTVTFINAQNGANVPVEYAYGATPSYTPVKEADAQYTYYFQYWLAADETTQYSKDATLPAVTNHTTYTAVWSQNVNKYSVIWKNGEETLETDAKQAYGATVSYDGATPTKEEDANFAYTHDGWSLTDGGEKLLSMPTVTGEMTFYAHFGTTPRYKVTFANYDGTSLQQEQVTQGVAPIYKGLTPGRARDLDGYYYFTGWKNGAGTYYGKDATLPVVTGKETFTAQYDYVNELYLITLNDVDGAGDSWSGRFGVGATPFYNRDYNDVAVEPTKASTAQYEYTFDYWIDALENHYELNSLPAVTGIATYTAQFEQHTRKYNITFANLDGNGASQTIEVEYGTTPVSPVTPTKETATHTYEFLGWNNTIVPVSGDATYTAQFNATGTPREFPITFDPDNGVDPVVVMNVAYGETPAYPTPTGIPTKESDPMNDYTFLGWNDGTTIYSILPDVTGPAEYTAVYTPTIHTYTITFKDYDGTTLKTATLAYGATPTCDDPVRPIDEVNRKKFTFTGWSPAIATVTTNATYTATYSELTYVASVTPVGGEPDYKSSWDEAYNMANNNSTGGYIVKLYTSVESATKNVSKSMTIDLNGCTISGTSSSNNGKLFNINSASTLTIDDSHGGGLITFTGTTAAKYFTIDVTSGSGVVVVNGGTIQVNNTASSHTNKVSAIRLYYSGSTAYINGGTLIATPAAGSGYVIDHDNGNYGYVYITGGKLKASTGIIEDKADKARNVISGGYFSMNPASKLTMPSGSCVCVVPDSDPAKAEGYDFKVAPGAAITWKNGDATIKTENWETGTTPVYTGAEPTKTNPGQYVYNFTGWTPTITPVSAAATYTATYDLVGIDADQPSTPLVVDANTEVQTTIVRSDGTLTINTGSTLTTDDLILEAKSNESGQITDGSSINVTGNVYYDLKLNTAARHWHAFGVPWNVDVTANPMFEVETGRTLVVGRDCEIVYYNGETRASQGPGAHCWNYLKHYSGDGHVDVMTPGKGYMIAFTSAVQTVRLTKAEGAPIFFGGENSVTGGAGEDGGWNAIANPMAYHATLNAGPTVGYVHDGGEIGSDGYTPYDINGTKYIVGKMVYVQATEDASIVVAPAGTAGDMTIAAAPKRTKAESVATKKYLALSDYYAVSLSNGEQASKVYVLPEEDKADEYVIGHDLSQFSMNATKPQIWVNRYDTKLALNTTAPINEVADYPVSLYAPVAGEYTITNTFVPNDDYAVYLTLDGRVIWNLSNSEYTLSLSKGTTTGYGIRLSAHAPQITTDIGEAVVDAQGETQKVIIEDKVFIIRGNEVYTIDGRLVK